LAISRQLCELMSGAIVGESALGQGSTFRFHLRVGEKAASLAADAPVDVPAVPAVSAPAASTRSEARSLRILAAEDHPTNRMVLEALLKRASDEITVVENGVKAVDAWKTGSFDVVLMDIQMPEMDGVCAALEIRRLEAAMRRPRTPIIAVTANVMTDQVEAYLAAGMDGCVSNPIEPKKLFRAMLAAMSGGATGGAALIN
jgi:CheY-like chemotaxis protein